MPLIVVGADTPWGRAITERVLEPNREIRAFVTSAKAADELRGLGVKVATGDVSDDSHVGGACLNCFTAVLVGTAARDDRERSFAHDEASVLAGWAEAAKAGGVKRVIWVDVVDPPPIVGPEVHTVSIDSDAEIPDVVRRLDEAGVDPAGPPT